MAIDIWYMEHNKHSQLSNLAPRPFNGARRYMNVEQAYQSNKSGIFDKETYRKIYTHGMKVRGLPARTVNDYNLRLMAALIRTSFDANRIDRDLLVSTYPTTLTHNNDRTIFRTEFPRMLTELREYYYYN